MERPSSDRPQCRDVCSKLHWCLDPQPQLSLPTVPGWAVLPRKSGPKKSGFESHAPTPSGHPGVIGRTLSAPMTRRTHRTTNEKEINLEALNATLNCCDLTEETPAKEFHK